MAVEFKDYYKTLDVSRSATDEEIRKAFRKLARKYHPDVAKDKTVAEEKFKEINEADEVLGDVEKRKKYDTLGADWKQGAEFRPPPGWQESGGFGGGRPGEHFEFHFGGTGFSDFFEQFFGGTRGAGGGEGVFEEAQGPRGARGAGGAFGRRGQDVEGDLLVTLHEAFHGSVRTVSLRSVDPRTGETGTHSFRVRIPAGVHEGQLIRVAGKGETGAGGGAPGDLYLRVRFAKHPDFRVRGSDLYYDLELMPWDAVLGATVSVPTLDGNVSLRVQPGTRTGHKLRVRGNGMPAGKEGRGDLYAVVTIQVPEQVSEEQRKLWEKLAGGNNEL
jgi:curved DNA-binding protein